MKGVSMIRCLAFLFLANLWSGCSTMSMSMIDASVRMVDVSKNGKALFVVSPKYLDNQNCDVLVKGKTKNMVSCNSEYLLSCDANRPTNKPFCELMTEKGSVRDSYYPKKRR
jgi:hypothetical protein